MDILSPQYTQKQEAIGARKGAIVILLIFLFANILYFQNCLNFEMLFEIWILLRAVVQEYLGMKNQGFK